MKNKYVKLSSLAALSLVTGAMSQGCAKCTEPSSEQTQQMMSQLDRSHQKMYNSMDCEGKNMAMRMVNQSCAGQNSCAGENSCAGANNSCAGMGSCKGTSKGPFTDKNKAVEMANKKMMMKRSGSMNKQQQKSSGGY